MEFYTADYILPISSEPIPMGVVAFEEGVIKKIGRPEEFSTADIQKFDGILMPGFINAHCHLELSHMQGLAKTGTGLIPFITDVVKLRDFEQKVILDAIDAQDKAMHQSGIQAVGDISNKTDTVDTKNNSKIAYYTFVEMFDFMQDKLTVPTINNYRKIFIEQSDSGNNKKSFVAHAPYSVSKQLFDFINKANPEDVTISIHNQETPDENLLFKNGTGGFFEFYKRLGFNLDWFQATGEGSIFYALSEMIPKKRNLFVHNTMTTKEEIHATQNWSENVYWATCPNANLFIENRLPNYKVFLDAGAKICIGTDSLMSNWQLSIWEEIKTIKQLQSYVPLTEVFKWATLNGAESLGYENNFGSLEVGKSPGLVNIPLKWAGEKTSISETNASRICD